MAKTVDSYFIDVVTSVFDNFFRDLGAKRDRKCDDRTVRYSTEAWFAEVLWLSHDGPRYSPRVEIGCNNGQFDDPRRNRVDVMHTAPLSSEECEYNIRWRYENCDELRTALVFVRDRILAVHTLPFLQNPALLKSLLIRRRDILESEWVSELNDHNDSVFRARAENAFRSNAYAEAVQWYHKIPIERLTRIDQSKMQIAIARMK